MKVGVDECSESPKKSRFGGIPTFFSTTPSDDLDALDIALVGVPFDGGVTHRPGARHGPREIRNQSSLLRHYNQLARVAPTARCRIADVGDAPIEHLYELERSLDDIRKFYVQLHAAGVVPVSAGGDHSITLPILRGIASERPVALLHFDAHCDTTDDYMGSKFHHGAPFRWAAEEGLIDPSRTVQIGIRGGVSDSDTWKFSHDAGMRVVYMDELVERGARSVINEAREIIGDAPVYVTFDVDGLDPAFAPGTGTPEVGGFSTAEAIMMLQAFSGANVIGGDVVEVAPPFDPSGVTALVGATMMFEILCLAAVAPAIAGRDPT